MTETKSKWKFLLGLIGYFIMAYGIYFASMGIYSFVSDGLGSPLALLVFGGAGAALIIYGYRLHNPKLNTWQLKLGFLSLVVSLISLRALIGEAAIHADTGEPLLEGIISFLIAGIILMAFGYFLIWPSLKEARDRMGLPILVTGLLFVSSYSAMVFHTAAPFILTISVIGIALIILGYYIMFIREPAH